MAMLRMKDAQLPVGDPLDLAQCRRFGLPAQGGMHTARPRPHHSAATTASRHCASCRRAKGFDGHWPSICRNEIRIQHSQSVPWAWPPGTVDFTTRAVRSQRRPKCALAPGRREIILFPELARATCVRTPQLCTASLRVSLLPKPTLFRASDGRGAD